MRNVLSVVALVLSLGAVATQAQQPDALTHVRDLYANAAYEDVLSTLATDAAPPPELGQYKVFSLIALGRSAEAEKAAEAVIIANPRFQADRDASPRVLELFTNVRLRIAPDLLKSMYVNAKTAFDRKDRDAAIRAFAEVVTVADDPDLRGNASVGELRLLASGFLDLSRALSAAAAVPVDAPAVPAAPASVSTPPPEVMPALSMAVPISETMPRWIPPESVARLEFRGRILVRIDADGNVVSSQMVTPTHPSYDAKLLEASKRWRYKPATTNGAPVASERIVEVALKPR